MERHPYRAILVYAVIVLSIIAIYPTIGWMVLGQDSRESRLAAWADEDAARAREEAGPLDKLLWSIKRWSEFDRDRVIDLGLDLQGGVHMVVGFDPGDPDVVKQMKARELEVEEVQEIVLQRVQNRVDEFEAKEPTIQKLGDTQVQIQLPGEKDVQRAQNLIMRTAFLTFHLVDGPDGTNQLFRKIDTHFSNGFVPFLDFPFSRGGPYQISEENFDKVRDLVEQANQVPGLIPENKTVAFSAPPKPWEQHGYLIYVMDKEAAMSGEGMTNAVARPDTQRPGQWQIMFNFNGESARDFGELTGNNINRSMAIVLDDRVVSAPNIESRIFDSGNITGSFTAQEAQDLAIALNSGSMPVPIREEYSGVVGPTLGQDSVTKGVTSTILSFLIVMAFMGFYYRVAGLVAIIALAVNSLLVIAALAYFNATLTLPGIAGLILTIGMAVDANVLIYERIREELRLGKSLVSAIDGAYARATITILDANITTLIAAAVLAQFGTGPVRGFAVTLSIGVVTSVFAALIVTRAVLDFLTSRKMIKSLSMASFIGPQPRFDFLGKRRLAIVVSVIVIIAGLGVFIARGSGNFGVDFTNGTNMTIHLDSGTPIEVGAIRTSLNAAGFDSPSVQEYHGDEEAPNEFVIRVGVVDDIQSAVVQSNERAETVATRVQSALLPLTSNPQATGAAIEDHVKILRLETVGPAVGRQLQRDALAAIGYSVLFILAYLWFRFELKFAVGAVVALIHDVLITIGIFAALGREITIPVIAAILTIIGYSLNDTIIVFDRVRENLRLSRGKNKTLIEILDASVNDTLSRTILTSGTTLFVVVVLLFFGGVAIKDFALALLIGIVVGTFSSVYIASPTILVLERWRERRIGAGTHGTREGREGSRRTGKKKSKKPAAGEETAAV